jgi:hypothetical protein
MQVQKKITPKAILINLGVAGMGYIVWHVVAYFAFILATLLSSVPVVGPLFLWLLSGELYSKFAVYVIACFLAGIAMFLATAWLISKAGQNQYPWGYVVLGIILILEQINNYLTYTPDETILVPIITIFSILLWIKSAIKVAGD